MGWNENEWINGPGRLPFFAHATLSSKVALRQTRLPPPSWRRKTLVHFIFTYRKEWEGTFAVSVAFLTTECQRMSFLPRFYTAVVTPGILMSLPIPSNVQCLDYNYAWLRIKIGQPSTRQITLILFNTWDMLFIQQFHALVELLWNLGRGMWMGLGVGTPNQCSFLPHLVWWWLAMNEQFSKIQILAIHPLYTQYVL